MSPYSPGHVINEAEADALNQTFVQNIGNNVHSHITEMQQEGKPESDIRQYVLDYAARYKLGENSQRVRGPADEFKAPGEALALFEVQQAAAREGAKLTSKEAKKFARDLYQSEREQRKAASRSTASAWGHSPERE
jgi:hypothetical protein